MIVPCCLRYGRSYRYSLFFRAGHGSILTMSARRSPAPWIARGRSARSCAALHRCPRRSPRTPKEREPMKIVLGASAMLLALSTAAWGQQPAVYPLRSQSAAAQGVDSAYCYWHAKQETGVDMRRLSQRPPRTKAVRFAPDAGKGVSEPPLPQGAGVHAGQSGAESASGGASATHAASSRPAQPSALGASTAQVASASAVQAGSAASPAQPGAVGAAAAAATAAGPAAASSTISSSGAASANAPPLPALPPPEPPMATYWHAYGDCMQARGYGVQ